MLSALTAGLATLFGLLAAGVHPSADPEFGVTAAFVLGIASLAGGASLVSMVGGAARVHNARLAQVATFQMEAVVFFDRALACRTDKAADELVAEMQAWKPSGHGSAVICHLRVISNAPLASALR
jgi:hypothetical protein